MWLIVMKLINIINIRIYGKISIIMQKIRNISLYGIRINLRNCAGSSSGPAALPSPLNPASQCYPEPRRNSVVDVPKSNNDFDNTHIQPYTTVQWQNKEFDWIYYQGRIQDFLKEGAPKLSTDTISAHIVTGGVWGRCAPSEAEKNCNFHLVHSFCMGANTKSDALSLQKNRVRPHLNPSLITKKKKNKNKEKWKPQFKVHILDFTSPFNGLDRADGAGLIVTCFVVVVVVVVCFSFCFCFFVFY